MNKIEKILLDSIKEMNGFILGFGTLDDKVINSIKNNKNIFEFTMLNNGSNSGDGKKGKNSKKLPYRKIRKKFINKNVGHIIAYYDELDKYHRRFISDSLYLANSSIYIYMKNTDIDIDLIVKRYQRYQQHCELVKCRDGFVLKITKNDYKKNIFRDIFYLFIDFILDGINLIGDLFIS